MALRWKPFIQKTFASTQLFWLAANEKVIQ